MKKIIIAALLTIPFTGNVIAKNNNVTIALKTEDNNIGGGGLERTASASSDL